MKADLGKSDKKVWERKRIHCRTRLVGKILIFFILVFGARNILANKSNANLSSNKINMLIYV